MSDEMDEIWALYADDGAQALDAMETALLALEAADGADTAGHVAALFRAVHTFKGNSRVLGLAHVESRAHLSEDLIGLVRDSGVPLDGEIISILLLAADTLRTMLQETATTRADVDPARSEALMHRLRDKIARCKGEAAPPAPVSPPPAPSDPVVPEPAEHTAAADPTEDFGLPAEPPRAPVGAPQAAPSRLVDDPAYRAIFLGMLDETQAKLTAALEAGDDVMAATRRPVDGLAHAARQLGLSDWASALDAFAKHAAIGAEQIAALLLELDERRHTDFGVPPAPPNDNASFLEAVGPALSDLAALGLDFETGEDHIARRRAAVRQIIDPAAARGFVRVAEAASALTTASGRAAFREGELRLYEELAAVEAALDTEVRREISPRALLLSWCADHVFDTLGELSDLLDLLRAGTAQDADYNRFGQLMRRVYHACQHHHIDMAAQLSMSLLDLFARQQMRGGAPDPILDHIAQGYISTIELVFDSLADGQELPQGGALKKLLAQASNIAFAAEGVASVSAIKRRLGLPDEFQRVLSPESVRSAAEALEAGLHFHIIRADINDDQTLAETFVLWLGQHGTRAITNVTVFRDADTLFDFLIASPLSGLAIGEALARMDPAAARLRLMQTLTPVALQDDSGDESPPAADLPPGISAGMLERIGEIATGQAMIRQMQQDLTEVDLVAQVEARLRAAGSSSEVRAEVRDLLMAQIDRLREIAHLEGQLLAQMSLLQEEAASLRSRPADVVLQPVAILIRTLARQAGRDVTVSTVGGDLALDLTVLDTLRSILRMLAQLRVKAAPASRAFRLTFRRSGDSIQAMIEDDDPAPLTEPALKPVLEMVAQARGRLRQVSVPGGGTRIHLSLPISMVVIDGMVVGVGGVRYVLPVETVSSILRAEEGAAFDIAAERGRRMLRLPSHEIIPVRPLAGGHSRESVYVILAIGDKRVAVPVDEVIGQQLVLLRPLRGVLSRLDNLTGIALLAGGEVGMVVSGAAVSGAEAA